MNTGVIIAIISVFFSNGASILAATWRVSSLLAKIDARLGHVDDKLSIHQSATSIRLASLEERVTFLERASRAAAD